VDGDPLVVPGEGRTGPVEDRALRHSVLAQQVDRAVVRVQQRDVQAEREQVNVVAGVADERHALLVARHVVAAGAEQELRRVVEIEQEGRADRAVRVEDLQVELRGAGVEQRLGVDAAGDGRAVRGDVVGDELAEERPAGGLGGVVAVGGQLVEDGGRVADPAGAARAYEQRRIRVQRFQLREHAPVARRPAGPVHGARRAEAVGAAGDVGAVGVCPSGSRGYHMSSLRAALQPPLLGQRIVVAGDSAGCLNPCGCPVDGWPDRRVRRPDGGRGKMGG